MGRYVCAAFERARSSNVSCATFFLRVFFGCRADRSSRRLRTFVRNSSQYLSLSYFLRFCKKSVLRIAALRGSPVSTSTQQPFFHMHPTGGRPRGGPESVAITTFIDGARNVLRVLTRSCRVSSGGGRASRDKLNGSTTMGLGPRAAASDPPLRGSNASGVC